MVQSKLNRLKFGAINRAEVDIQNHRKKPRDVKEALNKITTYTKMDKETAEDCFYVLRRRAQMDRKILSRVCPSISEINAGA